MKFVGRRTKKGKRVIEGNGTLGGLDWLFLREV